MEKGKKKNREDIQKKSKMIDINVTIPLIALNLNGLKH